jgi:diamine N-acetyltransferase
VKENIAFKTATIADLETIQQLANEIWHEHYSSIITLEQINYMLKKMYSVESLTQQIQDGCEFVIEYVSEIPTGFLSFSKKNETDFFIHKLYVDVSQHRVGLGKALLDEGLKRMKHFKKITLTVNRQNFKAINFYFKNGFIIEQVADFDIGNNFLMNDFVMVKIN